MQHQIDVAHILGQVGKWLIVLAVFGLSLTLSYMFFLAIAPPDKPWFPIAGLSLTEGGFLVWMFVFRMIRYHPVHKSIALLMTLACAACSLVVAGFELYGLLASHFDLLTNPMVAQYVALFLLAIFAAHFVSLIAELLVGEHQKNPFVQRGNRNAIPQNHQQTGYAIQEQPRQRSDAQLEAELRNNPMYAAWFNWMETQRGESARPLASRKSNQPKEEAVNLEDTAEVETPQIEQPKRELKPLPRLKTPRPVSQNPQNREGSILSEGVSMLTQKLSGFIRNGKTAGHAPGNGKTNTSKNTSTKG
jgi:hypothetical protein